MEELCKKLQTLSKEELTKLLYLAFTKTLDNGEKVISLDNLDFTPFDVSVSISGMKVNKTLLQFGQVVGEMLVQQNQIVKGDIYQIHQKAKVIFQNYQDASDVKN